jgi:hypothetical protein
MLDTPAQAPAIHAGLVGHQLARSYAGIWAGAPAKIATVSAAFGIATGAIGVLVDLPTLASRL